MARVTDQEFEDARRTMTRYFLQNGVQWHKFRDMIAVELRTHSRLLALNPEKWEVRAATALKTIFPTVEMFDVINGEKK